MDDDTQPKETDGDRLARLARLARLMSVRILGSEVRMGDGGCLTMEEVVAIYQEALAKTVLRS